MVSRKKILSRSRDDLTADDFERPFSARFEEDVWYTKQKLFTDHVEEILKKWEAIDDEIWAKAIVMERNRRLAKAYARAPVLTINGGDGGFDGFRLGLNGFSNPMRDPKTEQFKESIGLGAKVKMDESGNILIKRLSKSPVYVHSALEEYSTDSDLQPVTSGLVDIDKPLRVFDMRKFQLNINKELRRSNPDRVRLESQCVTCLCFVKDEVELLDSPIWVLLINIVALEMLKAKLPNSTRVPLYQMQTNGGEKRYPVSGSSDEDPYSLTSGHCSSGSSNPKQKRGLEAPPEKTGGLLKKEKDFFVPQNWSATQERRRDRSRDNFLEETESSTLKPRSNNRRRLLKKSDEKKKIVDDPYYCGFKARVPKFAEVPQHRTDRFDKAERVERAERGERAEKGEKGEKERVPKYREPGVLTPSSHSAPNLAQIPQVQPYWWQSRLYPDKSRVFPDQNRGYPEHIRRYPEQFKGGLPGYGGGYMDRLQPYSFGNEFSSLQFTARAGLPALPAGRPAMPHPTTPATPTAKPRKNFLSRAKMFKS